MKISRSHAVAFRERADHEPIAERHRRFLIHQPSAVVSHPGFSLPEMLATIAIIGILAAIIVPVMSGLVPSANDHTARRNLNLLNGAVVAFNQSNHELILETATDTSDDLAIIRSLQYAPPAGPGGISPSPGAPYFNPMARVVSSNSDETFRASWNGRIFQMIRPGTGGAGIDLMLLSDSASTPPNFPSGYKPVGAP